MHINSKIRDTPNQAVPPADSSGGETSTKSAPTRFTSTNSRTTCWAWKLFGHQFPVAQFRVRRLGQQSQYPSQFLKSVFETS